MKHHHSIRRAFGVAVLLATALAAGSHAQPADAPLAHLMKQKLVHAQGLMTGLAMENFDSLEKDAQTLAMLSKAAEWNVHNTPQYARFSAEFRDSVTSLAAHAREKKLEACALDYIQMTMTCVQCHQHVRAVKVAMR